jgi:hypothetical protein
MGLNNEDAAGPLIGDSNIFRRRGLDIGTLMLLADANAAWACRPATQRAKIISALTLL